MNRRFHWQLLGTALLGAVLLACQPQAPATPQAGTDTQPGAATPAGAAKAPDIKMKIPESIPAQKAPQPPSAQQAAGAPSPTAATAATKVEPKGRFVYGYHVALSPAWFDPQEVPAVITPWAFIYAMHDGLVKHMPGQPFAPSLAESYQIPDDARMATFKLREGIKFHNGDPVTPEDVKWTFENYRGANAKVLKDKTERIEIVDNRTIRFHFKEPFFDFLVLYGSPTSGAGWVVPQKYYQEVGPDGFKQKPIGAGPYKFVRFATGNELEVEAFADYWRKTPAVKTLIFRELTDDTTRLAALQAGEVDAINLVPGPLIPQVQQDPKLQLAPTLAAPFFLEFVGFTKPDNPFRDVRVREAASLALDRKVLSEAETGGLSPIVGSWIPADWPGALEGPEPKYDPARARQLLAEAGYPNGFDVPELTPVPPYFSWAERVIANLREVGIRVQRLNQMERGAFLQKITEGPEAFRGIIMNASGAPGDAANRIRAYATCNGSSSRVCIPEIDEKFARYETSTDPRERERLLNEIQQYLLDEYIFPVVYRRAFVNAVGPRLANKWDDVFGAVPQYLYIGPYEDLKLKE